MPASRRSRATRLWLDNQTLSQCQFGVDPGPTVGLSRFLVGLLDVFEQQHIHLVAGRGWPAEPRVVTRPRHPQNSASHRDINIGIGVIGEFTDQPKRSWGRMFSRAKYAAARFRISFSISRRFLSRRSWVSSRFSALLGQDSPTLSSASAWASQFLRHDSLIESCLANAAIDCSPRRANSTARRRNSAG